MQLNSNYFLYTWLRLTTLEIPIPFTESIINNQKFLFRCTARNGHPSLVAALTRRLASSSLSLSLLRCRPPLPATRLSTVLHGTPASPRWRAHRQKHKWKRRRGGTKVPTALDPRRTPRQTHTPRHTVRIHSRNTQIVGDRSDGEREREIVELQRAVHQQDIGDCDAAHGMQRSRRQCVVVRHRVPWNCAQIIVLIRDIFFEWTQWLSVFSEFVKNLDATSWRAFCSIRIW